MNETSRLFLKAADELVMQQQQLIGPHQTQPTVDATKAYVQARQALLDTVVNVAELVAVK